MNNRINELFGEALDAAVPETWSTLNPEQLGRLKHRFAQLIVRECMDIAKQVENDKFDVAGSAEPEYRKGINDGRRNAAWGIKNRMKLHFGVAE